LEPQYEHVRQIVLGRQSIHTVLLRRLKDMNAKISPRWKALAVGFLVAVAVGVVAGVAIGADEPRPRIGGWPEDVNGDGVISDTGKERIPELVRAVGDSGVEGYVRLVDLEGPQPSNPDEAIAMSGQERVVPLYSDDGETVVDQYTISGSNPDESPSPSPVSEATDED
jgi:hypothetical protein